MPVKKITKRKIKSQVSAASGTKRVAKKRAVKNPAGASNVYVSRKRKGIEAQVRSAKGAWRSGNEAEGSRMKRAKNMTPANKAHAMEKLAQEGDREIAKRTSMKNRRMDRESQNAVRAIVDGYVAGTRRKIKGTNTGTGPKSVGVSAVKNRRAAAKKRAAQAKSASRK
tara:strand:+ start:309 stop:812 length:504 start_codon:yes stop_codon:yes gene_type:complete